MLLIFSFLNKLKCKNFQELPFDEIIGYISYAIKKVRISQLLIFEKNGLVWPADICQPIFFKYQKLRKSNSFYSVADVLSHICDFGPD